MEQSLSWEASRFSVKKIHVFFINRRFITGSLPLLQVTATFPCAEPDQFSRCPPHPTSWRSILILSSYLRLGLPSGLFSLCFPTKTLYAPLLFPIRATCPNHLILDFITRIVFGEEYRSLSTSLYSFLHSLVTSSLLGANILLSTLFWNTHSYVSPSI